MKITDKTEESASRLLRSPFYCAAFCVQNFSPLFFSLASFARLRGDANGEQQIFQKWQHLAAQERDDLVSSMNFLRQ